MLIICLSTSQKKINNDIVKKVSEVFPECSVCRMLPSKCSAARPAAAATVTGLLASTFAVTSLRSGVGWLTKQADYGDIMSYYCETNFGLSWELSLEILNPCCQFSEKRSCTILWDLKAVFRLKRYLNFVTWLFQILSATTGVFSHFSFHSSWSPQTAPCASWGHHSF